MFSKFQILGRLIKAKHKKTSSLVAIKERKKTEELYEKLWKNETFFLKKIEKESNVLIARLITKLVDTKTKKNSKYLLMEWVDGLTLVSYDDPRLENLSEEIHFLRMFLILVLELNKLHNIRIVHHDIKPDNVMFVSRGGVLSFLFIDFGFCCLETLDSLPLVSQSHGYTPSEQINGLLFLFFFLFLFLFLFLNILILLVLF